MPIKFRCPNPECKKPLSVKDELAGKRAACPACKKPLKIPNPNARAAELEALAMAALSESNQVVAPVAAPKFIKMECPMCAEMVEFPVAEAGKRAQCPECRNIIKVDELKVEKPKDWRQVGSDGKPMGARRENQEPEGAWGTNVSRGKVSRESLEEAGAIPDNTAPVSAATWVKRGLMGAGALLVLVAGVIGIVAAVSSGRQKQVLAQALELVEDKDGRAVPKYPDYLAAPILRSVGEVHMRERKAEKAKEYLNKARGRLMSGQTHAVERDALLLDIALLQIDLGGSEQQAIDKTHLEWNDSLKQIQGTLQAISSSEAKITAMRDVNNRLVAMSEGEKSLAVKSAVNPAPGSPEAAAEVALWLERGKPDAAKSLVPPPEGGKPISDRATRVGYAEGRALKGEFDEARVIAGAPGGQPLHKFEAFLAIAAVAQQRGNAAEFVKCLNEAIEVDRANRKNIKSPWLHFQMVRLMVRDPAQAATAKATADALEDPGAKARAQLEILLQHLEKSRDPVTQADAAKFISDRETMAYGQALEAIAQHTARNQSRAAALELQEGLEPRFRPFIFTGIALGSVGQKQ